MLENTVLLYGLYFPTLKLEEATQGLAYIKQSTPRTIVRSEEKNAILVSNKGHIIAPLHTVKPEFSDFQNLIVVDDEKNVYRVNGVLAYSKKYDLALLKSELERQVNPILIFPEKELNKNAEVFMIGKDLEGEIDYSFSEEGIFIQNKDKIKIKIVKVKCAYNDQTKFLVGEDGNIYLDNLEFSLYSNNGDSGKLMVNKNGGLVGILRSSNRKSLSYATPSSKIKELTDFYLENLKEYNK